jgi:hypothetical protein
MKLALYRSYGAYNCEVDPRFFKKFVYLWCRPTCFGASILKCKVHCSWGIKERQSEVLTNAVYLLRPIRTVSPVRDSNQAPSRLRKQSTQYSGHHVTIVRLVLMCGNVRSLKRAEFLVVLRMLFISDSYLYWPTISRPLKRSKGCENASKRPSSGLIRGITPPSKCLFHFTAHQRIYFQKTTLCSKLRYTNTSLFGKLYQHHSYQNTISWQNQISGIRGYVTPVKFILFGHSVYHETTFYHTDPILSLLLALFEANIRSGKQDYENCVIISWIQWVLSFMYVI